LAAPRTAQNESGGSLAGNRLPAGDRKRAIGVWSAWDIANIGDIGHTPGLLRLLSQYLPETPVILFANMLNDPVRRMLMRRFPGLEIHEGWLWGDTGPSRELRKHLDRCALFIRNSNMGSETEYMEQLISRKIPFGVYGQTYPPRFVNDPKQVARNLDRINRARFFFCREKETLAMLEKAGAACPNLAFVPDAAFGIDVRDDVAGLETMRQLGLEERKFITIQLRTTTPAHLPGELPPGYDPKWNEKAPNVPLDSARAAKYVELVVAWVRGTGQKVLIAPEAKKEMAHNLRYLYEPLPADVKQNVVHLKHFWNVDEAASIFARAHTVVCHEPHSPIIALANGVPVIHTHSTEHGPKSFMFRDIGLADWLMDHDATPASRMIETLFSIRDDYRAAQARVAAAMDGVRDRMAGSMQVLRNLLNQPG
jgi:polysaccharide pyruvyl transferase WcaK-like protein